MFGIRSDILISHIISTIVLTARFVQSFQDPTIDAGFQSLNLVDLYHSYSPHNFSGHQSIISGHYDSSFPPSFALLINFGLDGRIRDLYSTRVHQELCHENQIYDPFNNECRQVYCRYGKEFKNFQCVVNHQNDDEKPYLKSLDSKSIFINVTIAFKTNTTIDQRMIDDYRPEMVEEFGQKFVTKWNLPANHLINITMVYADQNDLRINFLIMKNNQMVKKLSETFLFKKTEYTILDMEIRAHSIHMMIPELKNFCMGLTEIPIWYWNSEFAFITRDNLTYLYVNGTGRIYHPGQFTGSILYLQNITNNTNGNTEYSSNAVVCEQSLIDEDCPRIMLNNSEYEFVNGTNLYSNGIHFDRYEITDNSSIFVCVPLPHRRRCFSGHFLNYKIQSILSTTLMSISIILLSLLLITFLRFGSIRESINGYNSINLAVCLEAMQILFLTMGFIQNCRFTAVAFHFIILTTISWSSIIAYEMHQTIIKQNHLKRENNARTRLKYALIAYLSPLIIVSMANIGDIFNIAHLKGDYGLLFPSKICWMRSKQATILYFIVPATLTVLYNLILYIRIVCNIRRDIKSFSSSFRKVSRISSAASVKSTISIISSDHAFLSSRTKLSFNQTSTFIRLCIPLGFTWIIALICTIIPHDNQILITIMSYIFIVANTSQGIVLFLAFGVYKKMFKC